MAENPNEDALPNGPELRIRLPPELEGGVWSNFAVVHHSPYEFTLDFIRLDFRGPKSARSGVVVQRVNMSPQFVEQLIRALNENMAKYTANLAPADLSSLEEKDG